MNRFLKYAENIIAGIGVISFYNAAAIAFDISRPTSAAWCIGIALVAIVVAAIIGGERESRFGS